MIVTKKNQYSYIKINFSFLWLVSQNRENWTKTTNKIEHRITYMGFSVKISRVTYCCRVLETSRFWTWLSRWRLGPTSASPRNYHRARIATFNVDRHEEAAGMKWSNKMAVKNTQTTQQTCLTKLVWRKGFFFFKEIVSKMVGPDNRCAIYTQALCLLFGEKNPQPLRSTLFSNTFFFLIFFFYMLQNISIQSLYCRFTGISSSRHGACYYSRNIY